MPRWLLPLLALWGAALAAGAHYYFSESQTLKRMVQASVEQMNEAMASKNVAGIQAYLEATLSADATVEFSVEQTLFGMKSNTILLKQSFNKADFIRFVSLNLETAESYQLTTRIEQLELQEQKFTANTYSVGQGRAPHYNLGSRIPMLYTAEMRCVNQGSLQETRVMLNHMQCHMGLGQRPEAASPDQLKELVDRVKQGK